MKTNDDLMGKFYSFILKMDDGDAGGTRQSAVKGAAGEVER